MVFLSVPSAGDVCAPRDLILLSAMYLTTPLEHPEGKNHSGFSGENNHVEIGLSPRGFWVPTLC